MNIIKGEKIAYYPKKWTQNTALKCRRHSCGPPGGPAPGCQDAPNIVKLKIWNCPILLVYSMVSSPRNQGVIMRSSRL